MDKYSWRIGINQVLEELNEKLIFCTLSEEELDKEFDNSYGSTEGKEFTAWTENYVLFPVQYDGSEWVDWTYRNPGKNNITKHIGG